MKSFGADGDNIAVRSSRFDLNGQLAGQYMYAVDRPLPDLSGVHCEKCRPYLPERIWYLCKPSSIGPVREYAIFQITLVAVRTRSRQFLVQTGALEISPKCQTFENTIEARRPPRMPTLVQAIFVSKLNRSVG
jgi:hypothetical protein